MRRFVVLINITSSGSRPYKGQAIPRLVAPKSVLNSGTTMSIKIEREQLEQVIFGKGGGRRFTQDSAILPDVWIKYGKEPDEPRELLLNPYADTPPGNLSRAFVSRMKDERQTSHWSVTHGHYQFDSGIAFNQAAVVGRIFFDELIRVVLPMSYWWNRYIPPNIEDMIRDWDIRSALAQALQDPLWERKDSPLNKLPNKITPEAVWLIRVVGTIEVARKRQAPVSLLNISGDELVASFTDLMEDFVPVRNDHQSLIWTVTLNRAAATTMWRSTLAVKADAALQLFNIKCEKITWAIIDTGIDAEHQAFRLRDKADKLMDEPFVASDGRQKNQTRVLATYDFNIIRQLLKTVDDPLDPTQTPIPDELKDRFANDDEEIIRWRQSLARGSYIDWDALKPLLEVPHVDGKYRQPIHEHGTHVAGILGADWRKDENGIAENQDLRGVCPDIRLYDLRALNDDGEGDEFTVMSALQFVRYLNSHSDFVIIHGVNLSLSLRHDVANYACGRTPVCDECERVVNTGVVVVAAAGNDGYLRYLTSDETSPENKISEGYRSISINDPGNADAVITVGSTHAFLPHTYGVSYFSSRGPTGDGRIKPDLVAPGEKITSTVPGNRVRRKDGTSMAAPHVSGAAALLLARYSELIGQPGKVKKILCSTATDLGRERYFQGSGMLDILRALQSV